MTLLAFSRIIVVGNVGRALETVEGLNLMAKGRDNAPKICNLYCSEGGSCVLNQLCITTDKQ